MDLQITQHPSPSITGAGGPFECPHLCQLSKSLGGSLGSLGLALHGIAWHAKEWRLFRPDLNGQLLHTLQPRRKSVRKVSPRKSRIASMLFDHCLDKAIAVRGFTRLQVRFSCGSMRWAKVWSFVKFSSKFSSLFPGRGRMLLWFGCCQILLKHRSSQSVSGTEKVVIFWASPRPSEFLGLSMTIRFCTDRSDCTDCTDADSQFFSVFLSFSLVSFVLLSITVLTVRSARPSNSPV